MNAPYEWRAQTVVIPGGNRIRHPFPGIASDVDAETVQTAIGLHIQTAIRTQMGRAVLYNHIVGTILAYVTSNALDACVAGGMAVWLIRHSCIMSPPFSTVSTHPWWPEDVDIFVSDMATEQAIIRYLEQFYGATLIEQAGDSSIEILSGRTMLDIAGEPLLDIQQRMIFHLLLATLKRCRFPLAELPLEVATAPRSCRLATAGRYDLYPS